MLTTGLVFDPSAVGGAFLVNCSEPNQPALLDALRPIFNLSSIRPVMNMTTCTNISTYFTMYGILGVVCFSPQQIRVSFINVYTEFPTALHLRAPLRLPWVLIWSRKTHNKHCSCVCVLKQVSCLPGRKGSTLDYLPLANFCMYCNYLSSFLTQWCRDICAVIVFNDVHWHQLCGF